jgi:CBS domain-containing protein
MHGLLFEVWTVDIELNLMTESVDHAGPIEPLCVPPETPIRDVLVLLRERNRPSALVCRDDVLIGVFTERDALRVMAQNIDLATPIERMMTPRPVTVQAGEKIGAAVQKMATGGYRRLPIVDSRGRPVGLVHVSGIVHYLVEHFPKTIYNLPPVPHAVMQQREGP